MLDKILNCLENLYQNVETIKKIIEILRKLKKELFYLLLLFYIVILACRIPFLRRMLYKTRINPFVEYIYIHGNLCIFILLAVLVAVMLYKIWKSAKYAINYADSTKLLIRKLHESFIHDIRDNIRQLDQYEYELQNLGDNSKAFILKQMYQTLSDNMQVYVDFLEGQGNYQNIVKIK